MIKFLYASILTTAVFELLQQFLSCYSNW